MLKLSQVAKLNSLYVFILQGRKIELTNEL